MLILVAILVLVAKAYNDTTRSPVVERFTLKSAKMPAGSPPITVVLLSDIHVAGPDMPPTRLARIVEQVNALEPDLVAIAGDLVSEKRTATTLYSPLEIVEPLGQLKSRYGTVIVPGNHDHWYDWEGLAQQLAKHPNITVLVNSAAQFGPVTVGGVDDAFTRRDDMPATIAAMEALSGPRIMLTHSPDVFPQVPVGTELTLAGHTHCGQIGYPWGGSPATCLLYTSPSPRDS